MDWFTRVKPIICWKKQTLTINQNGVNFNILKEPNDLILRDTIFVQVINKDDLEELKKESTLHVLRYKPNNKENEIESGSQSPKLKELLQEYKHIFKEELTELSPEREVKHAINLHKAMSKASPLYRLSHQEMKTLKNM